MLVLTNHLLFALLTRRQLFTEVYLVTNADKYVLTTTTRSGMVLMFCCCAPTCIIYIYSTSCSNSVTRYKHYERWATANDFPVENVINDGSTTLEDQLGAVADLQLAIRSRKLQDDIMVVRLSQ